MLAFCLAAALPAATESETGPTTAELDSLTSLIEWILDGRFTPEERNAFQKAAAASWTNMEPLAKLPAALETLPADKKAELRTQIQNGLLTQLRQSPNDPASQLLLAVHERGRAPNASGFPKELVGEWSSVRTSSVNFVDRSTGSHAPPSGEGTQYRFFPDGRFQSASLIQSSLYNCTMTVNAFEEGTLRLSGRTMTFHSKGGTLDSKDNCNASFNYTKKLPATQTTYTWRLERDQWGTKFCIVRPGAKEDCAYKK